MTSDEALVIVVETAFEWAGEYGFAIPQRAQQVWDAARLLRPDLEPTNDAGRAS